MHPLTRTRRLCNQSISASFPGSIARETSCRTMFAVDCTAVEVLPLPPATNWHSHPSSLSVSRDVVPTVSVLTLATRRPEGIQRARFLATPLPHRRSLTCSLLENGLPEAPHRPQTPHASTKEHDLTCHDPAGPSKSENKRAPPP